MEGYTVENTGSRVVIKGSLPIDDLVALQKSWKKHGLDSLALGVATSLGATMAVCRKDDVEVWEKEVGQRVSVTANGDAELEWLLGTDTGVSSVTVFSVLASDEKLRRQALAKNRWPDNPHDPDDFGRCYRLLEKFPAWRSRLDEVAAAYPKKYRLLVAAWPRLEELWREESPKRRCPKLYDLMREIIDAQEGREPRKRKHST